MCLNPIKILDPNYKCDSVDNKLYKELHYISVPCGHCIQCLNDKRNEWYVRLCKHYDFHNTGFFLTLTYNDRHLPNKYTINKHIDFTTGELIVGDVKIKSKYSVCKYRDIQLFFKRLRRNLDTSLYQEYCKNYVHISRKKFFSSSYYKKHKKHISYFTAFEYGPSKHRAHWHLLIFGIDYHKYRSLIDDAWNNGFTYFGQLNYKTIRYVTKYITKSWVNNTINTKWLENYNETSSLGLYNKPCYHMSKKLGYDFISQKSTLNYYLSGSLLDICKKSNILINGHIHKLPRYYKEYLYKIPHPEIFNIPDIGITNSLIQCIVPHYSLFNPEQQDRLFYYAGKDIINNIENIFIKSSQQIKQYENLDSNFAYRLSSFKRDFYLWKTEETFRSCPEDVSYLANSQYDRENQQLRYYESKRNTNLLSRRHTDGQ